MKDKFLLFVRDSEDDYVYSIWLYETFEELKEAKRSILEFDKNWYKQEDFENENYFESLKDFLNKKGIKTNEASCYNVYIR